MLGVVIRKKTIQWLQSDDCSINELLQYIRTKGALRETQIEAIETYLFLKIKGKNKPLWQLFSEGLFNTQTDLQKFAYRNVKSVNFMDRNHKLTLYSILQVNRMEISN